MNKVRVAHAFAHYIYVSFKAFFLRLPAAVSFQFPNGSVCIIYPLMLSDNVRLISYIGYMDTCVVDFFVHIFFLSSSFACVECFVSKYIDR